MARSHKNQSKWASHAAVEEIGTEPLTSHQREQAVSALAALIGAWQQNRDLGTQAPGNSATPLPLPGTASDTDHAV